MKHSQPHVEYADLDDMLFENREKAYGAYQLRKNYPWHLFTALALVMSVFLMCTSSSGWRSWWNLEKVVAPSSLEYVCCDAKDLEREYKLWFSDAFRTQAQKTTPMNLDQVERAIGKALKKNGKFASGGALVRVLVNQEGLVFQYQVTAATQADWLPFIDMHIYQLAYSVKEPSDSFLPQWNFIYLQPK